MPERLNGLNNGKLHHDEQEGVRYVNLAYIHRLDETIRQHKFYVGWRLNPEEQNPPTAFCDEHNMEASLVENQDNHITHKGRDQNILF